MALLFKIKMHIFFVPRCFFSSERVFSRFFLLTLCGSFNHKSTDYVRKDERTSPEDFIGD